MKLASVSVAVVVLGLLVAGCEGDPEASTKPKDKTKSTNKKPDTPPATAASKYSAPTLPANAKKMAKDVYLLKDGDKTQIYVGAKVCLREGQLEGLLTKPGREHEYPLVTDADASFIHGALLAAGAKPGTPVRYDKDQVITPSGQVINVNIQYRKNGQDITVPASTWLMHLESQKDLDLPWVFAGSHFHEDPDKVHPPFYGANAGEIICTCNMPDAMLDLPIRSATAMESRVWCARRKVIPPLNTKVFVIL